MFVAEPMELVHYMRRLGHVGVTVALATFVGCAYHMPTSPTTPETTPNLTPASIRVTTASRTDQKIDVTATVLSGDGHDLGNVLVTFSVDAGTISPASAVTDANGSARATASTPSATTLHVTGAGLSTQLSLPASVAPTAVDSVILNVPGTGTVGTPVTMFVSSSGSGPWSWNFGDGATAQTTGLSTTHTYGRPGGFTVTVTGPNGTTSSGNITITDVLPTPPEPPKVTGTSECVASAGTTAPFAVSCHVTLIGALTSTITSVNWDFGDGSPLQSGGASATHSYLQPGTYTVVANAQAPDAPNGVVAQTTVTVPLPAPPSS
jgi:hypothetical protein